MPTVLLVNATATGAVRRSTRSSPAPDTTVTPGESLAVEVAGSPDIATILVVMSQPGDRDGAGGGIGPGRALDLQVPDTGIGLQNRVPRASTHRDRWWP